MKRTHVSFITVMVITVLGMGCQIATEQNGSVDKSSLFPKGQPVPAEFFTGNAWVTSLVDSDSVFTTSSGSVLFKAGARTNWHLHPSGQILIVTSGVGYHQIKGRPVEIIRSGDVVKCPPDVLHWHGASRESSMSHIYILPNTEKGIVEWKAPVTDEEYRKL